MRTRQSQKQTPSETRGMDFHLETEVSCSLLKTLFRLERNVGLFAFCSLFLCCRKKQKPLSYERTCCVKVNSSKYYDGLNGTVHGGYLYKLRKPMTQRRSIVQGNRRSVQQSSVDEPGPHHPTQVGRPGNHVTFPDVLRQTSRRGSSIRFHVSKKSVSSRTCLGLNAA